MSSYGFGYNSCSGFFHGLATCHIQSEGVRENTFAVQTESRKQ